MLIVLGSSVFVPLLAVLVMTTIKVAGGPKEVPLREVINAVGFDLCVLGIGLSGAVMAIPVVHKLFGGPEGAVVLTSCLLLAEILFGGIIVLTLKFSADDSVKMRVSAGLGFVSVGVPAAMIVLAHVAEWAAGSPGASS